MKNITTYIVVLILTTACSTRGFKPPPYFYELWQKTGSSELETTKKLLECGASSLYGNPSVSLYMQMNDVQESDLRLQARCMNNLGYVYTSDRGDICSRVGEKLKPACAPDAIIPTPSAERRLNSPFCKVYTKAEVCQP